MAYPTIVDYAVTPTLGNSTTYVAQDYPTTVNAGSLILAFFAIDGGVEVDTADLVSSGWTIVKSISSAGNVSGTLAARKSTDGSEAGGTFNVRSTASANETIASIVLTIDGWNGTVATDVEGADFVYDASNTDYDCPSHTASWGTADNLWLVFIGTDSTGAVGTYPTSPAFTGIGGDAGNGTAECGVWAAYYQYNGGATVDPAAEASGLSVGSGKVCSTFVVRPAGGASAVPSISRHYSRMMTG